MFKALKKSISRSSRQWSRLPNSCFTNISNHRVPTISKHRTRVSDLLLHLQKYIFVVQHVCKYECMWFIGYEEIDN